MFIRTGLSGGTNTQTTQAEQPTAERSSPTQMPAIPKSVFGCIGAAVYLGLCSFVLNFGYVQEDIQDMLLRSHGSLSSCR